MVQRGAMEKAEGAFLTISELANELRLPQHILRYWESRFPQLKPLQRAGNRRYYRPADVAVARRIHHLLNVEGFTVKGARKILANGGGQITPHKAEIAHPQIDGSPMDPAEMAAAPAAVDSTDLLSQLEKIRARLAAALGAA